LKNKLKRRWGLDDKSGSATDAAAHVTTKPAKKKKRTRKS
jgi:hypothetical protein